VTEENYEKFSQDSRSPGRDLNQGSPEYETDLFQRLCSAFSASPRRFVWKIQMETIFSGSDLNLVSLVSSHYSTTDDKTFSV
jgi:hypothetical protein